MVFVVRMRRVDRALNFQYTINRENRSTAFNVTHRLVLRIRFLEALCSTMQSRTPLLFGAEIDISQGWRPLAVAIEMSSRTDQHIHVLIKSECMGDADSELHDSVYKIIGNYRHPANCRFGLWSGSQWAECPISDAAQTRIQNELGALDQALDAEINCRKGQLRGLQVAPNQRKI